jgi:predicted porin
MKKIAFTSIALAASAAACAQSSVTIYGTMDLGVWHQSKTAGASPATNAGSRTSLNTGGTAPSVLGFRGDEDLGNGLKATFNLETHLDPSVGSSGLGAFWSRAANVGLAGSWGAVKLGQQIDPAVLGYAATDPRGLRESLSGVIPWAVGSAQNVGPGTAAPNNTLAFFASNSISYSATFGNAGFGLLYSLGEVAGNSKANRLFSGQFTYSGPVSFSAAYHQSNWASTGEKSDEKASVGAGVAIGAFNIKANYLSTKAFASTGVISGDWRVIGVGGDYQLSDRQLITAAYYRGKNRLDSTGNNKGDSFVVSGEHSLSKRTILYAQLADIKAGKSADAVVTLLGSQPVQDASTYVINLGIRHRF